MLTGAGGESVAYLKGTLQSNDGKEITVDAEFNTIVGGYTVSECEF
jgi:hypothetical protein